MNRALEIVGKSGRSCVQHLVLREEHGETVSKLGVFQFDGQHGFAERVRVFGLNRTGPLLFTTC